MICCFLFLPGIWMLEGLFWLLCKKQKQWAWPSDTNFFSLKSTLESVLLMYWGTLKHTKSSFCLSHSLSLFWYCLLLKWARNWKPGKNEWVGCLSCNWKHSLINDFVHAGVGISSPCWEGGFCIISWFALIIIPSLSGFRKLPLFNVRQSFQSWSAHQK